MLCHGTVCVVGKMRDLILQLSKSSIYSTKSPHDLRRTASTLLHEAGYNTDWIEKCLAHEQKGVRAVYNKAEYREQRAEMLQDWANMIDEWVSN
ncbi:tyrosine-type recombinase/integrase [Klebsiella pneumoniae]|uniref:tyrosine-type recombinase/integrase n=1 Tax=Klebsiella pneumoniae TaxID=573 RepID=UPI002963E859|nr:tyrosine-type recombinase/integrase [Klebsiella pneumoniae]MDW1314515.1 tyrosine-type recombinase/integrase [Klebsiella pneumoniae]